MCWNDDGLDQVVSFFFYLWVRFYIEREIFCIPCSISLFSLICPLSCLTGQWHRHNRCRGEGGVIALQPILYVRGHARGRATQREEQKTLIQSPGIERKLGQLWDHEAKTSHGPLLTATLPVYAAQTVCNVSPSVSKQTQTMCHVNTVLTLNERYQLCSRFKSIYYKLNTLYFTIHYRQICHL